MVSFRMNTDHLSDDYLEFVNSGIAPHFGGDK
jgi:hypothetical protein